MALAGQLQSILFTAQGLSQRYGNQGVQAVFNALPTRAQNADGSLGAVDTTPVAGNPINTDLVVGLNRACKASELIAVKNIMNDYITFMTNATVGATAADRTTAVDKIVGG